MYKRIQLTRNDEPRVLATLWWYQGHVIFVVNSHFVSCDFFIHHLNWTYMMNKIALSIS